MTNRKLSDQALSDLCDCTTDRCATKIFDTLQLIDDSEQKAVVTMHVTIMGLAMTARLSQASHPGVSHGTILKALVAQLEEMASQYSEAWQQGEANAHKPSL